MQTFLSDLQARNFLSDFAKRSETIILEEGKEKKELEAICDARHYSIKNSRDLAVFKTIYAFTDKANANGAILPKKELLRVLPQLIGKPISVNHNRNHVVGHYIDYRYKAKENMIIAYGVFYKSNFADLWEEAQELFKKNELGTSFEIWSPNDKRVHKEDGSYELHEMEIAGGALLFGEKPAFDKAKVLEMAKKKTEFPQELVRAMEDYKKYKDNDLIRPNIIAPKQITCSNCGEKITHNGIDIKVKCPKCKAILNSEGVMQFPPQIKDFTLLCPSCKVNNWLIMSREQDKATLKCLRCSKEYTIDFSKKGSSKLLENINFYYSGIAMCPQCKKEHPIEAISTLKTKTIKCNKCGLEFTYDLNKLSKNKKIRKVEEIKKEVKTQENTVKVAKSEEGGKQKMFTVELSKFHRYIDVENFDEIENSSIDKEYGDLEKAKRLTYQERKALPDNMFAVVVKVKNKRTGKIRKIRKYPINDEAHVRNALARLAQAKPRAELRSLGVSPKAVLKKILKRAKELKMTDLIERHKEKALTVKCSCVECGHELTTDQHCASLKCPKCGGQMRRAERPGDGKPEEKASVEKIETPVEPSALEKAIKQITDLKKELEAEKAKVTSIQKDLEKSKEDLEKTKSEADKKIELLKAKAKEVVKREKELGDLAKGMTDEEILNDDLFVKAKVKKANNELEQSDVIGDKSTIRDSEYYSKVRKEIDSFAFDVNRKRN